MHRLQCKAQNYAWGKPCADSLVAQLLLSSSSSQPTEEEKSKCFAELWMGTHPSAPSTIVPSSEEEKPSTEKVPLKQLLTQSNLGKNGAHAKTFGGSHTDLPYLFKVLSIDKALSIQCHPDKKLAEKLHREDPAHYPDVNHKPELVVAVTPFQALCCFRKVDQVVWFMKNIPELAKISGFSTAEEEVVSDIMSGQKKGDSSSSWSPFFRPLLSRLYKIDQQENIAMQEQLLKKFGETAEQQNAFVESLFPDSENSNTNHNNKMKPLLTRALSAFRQVYSQFPNDIGLWMVFFLNVLDLEPGDGLFLAANEPHAYLAGDCVEIMAASDNVIRAGLTPKFKDVDTLLECLTYKTDSLEAAAFKNDHKFAVQGYIPPEVIPEFRLEKVRLGKNNNNNNNKETDLAPTSSPRQEVSSVRLPLHSACIFIVMNNGGNNSSGKVSRVVVGEDGKELSKTTSELKTGDVQAVLLEEESNRHVYLEFEKNDSGEEEDLLCFVAQTRGDGLVLPCKL